MKMSKKIKIYLICISLISFAYLFLYPLPHLFGYNPLSLLTGLQNKITLSEPVIMFFLGAGLIGVAGFARRKFRSKTPS
jgi:polyferredoxin